MSVLADLDLDRITPTKLWRALTPEERELAARAALTSEEDEVRTEAHFALASKLRFRPVAIAKLPLEKRIQYLTRQVLPDDSLASNLLLSLHLEDRRDVLATFLDTLEIPHDRGLIDPDHDLESPGPDRLKDAADALFRDHDDHRAEVYLAALVALDPDTWSGVTDILRERSAN